MSSIMSTEAIKNEGLLINSKILMKKNEKTMVGYLSGLFKGDTTCLQSRSILTRNQPACSNNGGVKGDSPRPLDHRCDEPSAAFGMCHWQAEVTAPLGRRRCNGRNLAYKPEALGLLYGMYGQLEANEVQFNYRLITARVL